MVAQVRAQVLQANSRPGIRARTSQRIHFPDMKSGGDNHPYLLTIQLEKAQTALGTGLGPLSSLNPHHYRHSSPQPSCAVKAHSCLVRVKVSPSLLKTEVQHQCPRVSFSFGSLGATRRKSFAQKKKKKEVTYRKVRRWVIINVFGGKLSCLSHLILGIKKKKKSFTEKHLFFVNSTAISIMTERVC